MSIDRLSAIEVAYLDLEGPGYPMNTGAVAIFEGAPLLDRRGRPRRTALIRALEQRLHLIPKFRKVVAPAPLGIGRPMWVDDPDFDLARHVRTATVAPPGGEAELLALADRIQVEPLDRAHPLWELWLVSGLAGGRVAMVQKTHHALVDGVSGVDAASVLLDLTRKPAAIVAPPWSPAPPPGPVDLVDEAARQVVRLPGIGLRTLGRAARSLRHPVAGALTAGAVVGVGHGGPFAPHSSLSQPMGRDPRMVVVRSRLEPVRSVAHEHGVKVNDVALAVVTAGLRRLLVLRGERVDRPLRALVPVSLRGADEHGTLGNRVGSLIVPLPIGEPDPVARLRLIGAATAELKQRGDAQVSDGVLAATNLLPTSAVHAVSWIIEHQPLVNLVVTNVPGPSVPLYALGAEMIEAFPILPLAGNLTVGVAILSYNGELNFGIRADAVTCPDVDVLAEAIADAIDELTGHRPVAAMAHAAGAE